MSFGRFALTAEAVPGILSALAHPSIRLIVRVCFLAAFALALPDVVQAQSACRSDGLRFRQEADGRLYDVDVGR